jgi:hypothetical protein
LLNENKEAAWKEWKEKKGKGNKHLLLKKMEENDVFLYSYH